MPAGLDAGFRCRGKRLGPGSHRSATQELATPSHRAELPVPTERETEGLAKLISVDASESPGTIPVPVEAQ